MEGKEAKEFLNERLKEVELPEGWICTAEIDNCPGCGKDIIVFLFSLNGEQQGTMVFAHSKNEKFEDMQGEWERFVVTALERIKGELKNGIPEPEPISSGIEAFRIPGVGTMLVMSGGDLLRALYGIETDD